MKYPLTLLLFLALTAAAHADGGVLLQRWETSGLSVFLFGNPTPLRAGPAEFEILVQDSKTGIPRVDGHVRLNIEKMGTGASVEAWVPPCCRQSVPSGERWTAFGNPSTHGNRLCYSAPTILPSAGHYRITCELDGKTPVGAADIVVEPPLPPVVAYWPLIGLPFLAAGLFFVNRLAASR